MSLLPLLDQLQSQKAKMISDVESWPRQSITRKPSPDQWSAVEVLDHLVRTEVEILAAARSGMSMPHRIGLLDTLRTRFVHSIFRTNRKVKVPSKASQVLPGSNLELPAIVQRWSDSRSELSVLLKTSSEAELKKGIFKHPVSGWMGMPQILDFFSVHMIHHEFQLARLRNAISN